MRNGAKITGLVGILTMAMAAVAPGLAAQGASDGPAISQGAPTSDVARLGVTLGPGVMGGGMSGIAFHGNLGMEVAPGRVLTIRGAVVEEFLLFGGTPERVWDVGVLYGVQNRSKWSYASASAGLALVGGVRRDQRMDQGPCSGSFLECLLRPVTYTDAEFRTVGVALEVDAGLTFSPGLGLAASGWANVNTGRSMAGFSVGLVLGDLR